MTSESKNVSAEKRVAIVGGGLVGALQACFLARRGFQVDVFEMRHDIRTQQVVFGRSINLALSCRGREALAAMGIEDRVVENGIPMYGRMIHDLNGNQHIIPYGKSDQYIMSVDRHLLNEIVLTSAQEYPNIRLHFEHKFISCNFESGEIVFETANGDQVREKTDLIIGCDGAYSAVRNQIIKTTRMNFKQEYIPHGYIELCIPATSDKQFAMKKNYLHIWPRFTFMLIALPNKKDNSFVLTLFMPFDIFASLTDEAKLMQFFEEKFPDALPLIGREALTTAFFQLSPLALVSIKCDPFNVRDKAIILGDAAHAMVPFYGQGLNCGFEDLLVFDELMQRYNNDFAQVLPEFSEFRCIDVQAMNDLAMFNYVEMRASVTSKMFIVRKKLDNFLYWLMPQTWIPLYTMVSFTRTRYHECMARRLWQDKMLHRFILTAGASSLVASTYAAYLLFTTRSFQTFCTEGLGSKLPVLQRLVASRSMSS